MYVPSNYSNYKYLVSYGDNYVVLTNSHSVSASWDSPRTISTIIQYHYPSIYTLESSSTFTSNRTFEQVQVTDFFYSRADCPVIIITEFTVILFIIFIINGLTKFVKRGGIFFGQ